LYLFFIILKENAVVLPVINENGVEKTSPIVEKDVKKDELAKIDDDMPKVQRKRRWFTSNNDPSKNIPSQNSLPISSDSLKVTFLVKLLFSFYNRLFLFYRHIYLKLKFQKLSMKIF
jgi:hypothetical protein